MSHFTYTDKADVDYETLKQGDILQKNEEIKSIIAEIHPHYLKHDYKYFIVLTQSCDLVRRNGLPCKASYISLAAVRPFDLLLKREIEKYQSTDIEKKGKICKTEVKPLLQQFLGRLYNNNEQEYFYLNEDDSYGFSEPMVAFLRLSIAVKADLHYEKCLRSKIIELSENFTAKLGWLVGHMYSRVGTVDWVPDMLDENAFANKCIIELDKHALWYEEKIIKAVYSVPLVKTDFQKTSCTRYYHYCIIGQTTPVKGRVEICKANTTRP